MQISTRLQALRPELPSPVTNATRSWSQKVGERVRVARFRRLLPLAHHHLSIALPKTHEMQLHLTYGINLLNPPQGQHIMCNESMNFSRRFLFNQHLTNATPCGIADSRPTTSEGDGMTNR